MLRPSARPLLLAVAVLAACGPQVVARPASGGAAPDELEALREATRGFRSLDAAVAAGYPRDVRDCLVHEHHGAMGFHHLNRVHLDREIDVARPEILLYERMPDGTYRLNGVEFIVPYGVWPRDTVPPRALGQEMRREDDLRFWYLHVWAWTPNPDGPFADFHPGIQCPAASRKVFRPSGD